MKLYTATIDYFATGEGRSLYLFACHAESTEQVLEEMGKVVDPYFVQGAAVFEGLPPDDDAAAAFLLSDGVKPLLRGEQRCYLRLLLSLHYNFS